MSADSVCDLAPARQRAGLHSEPMRILAAVDGSAASMFALAAADAIAVANAGTIETIAVFPPAIPLPPSSERRCLAQCDPSERAAAAAFARSVWQYFLHFGAEEFPLVAPSLRFEVGDPGGVIIRTAETSGAGFVVLALDQREPLDERAQGRTAVCVARYLSVPLLAASTDAPLRRCLVVFPDGRIHEPTIRAVARVMSQPTHLRIVLPSRPPARGYSQSDPEAARSLAVHVCAEELIDPLPAIDVELVDMSEDELRAVWGAADTLGADLIAVPNHGSPGAVRAFLPNITEPVLASSPCSVLVVPAAF